MNIIFVSNKMAKARTLSLWQALTLLGVLLVVPPLLTAALILPQPSASDHGVQSLLPVRLMHAVRDNSQEHLNALALQLGEIQARVMRLDALSERLAKLAGVKEKDLQGGAHDPGRGGPMVLEHSMTEQEMREQMAGLLSQLEARSDRLGVLEAVLLQQNLKKNTIPTNLPVVTGYNSSSFGWRIDPFTGMNAFHEGVDFVAETGTPVYAAASGIVSQAGDTPDYGKLIKVDHGSGLETRYAHADRILVRPGDIVEKGQLIAEVGNTGRSTGAHLHFEVRLNGVALDPRKYLRNPNS